MSSTRTHVVIIGASYAGIPIAHSLLKDVPTAKVTLINPSPTFYFTVAAPRILAKPDAFKTEQYLLPIEKEFARYPAESFEFVQGRASAIDARAKTVSLGGDGAKTISFDYLVLASGSAAAPAGHEDAVPIPFKQSNEDDMEGLIRAAQDAIGRAEDIVIGGAGPIGVELAGEIAEAARLAGRKVNVTLVSASSRVLPMLKPAGSAAAEKLLADLGVKVAKGQKVAGAVRGGGAGSSGAWTVTLSGEGGAEEELRADMYIPATGVVPNNDFIPAEFLDESGWVAVDEELRVKGGGEAAPLPVYAAGDITDNSMRLSFKAQEQAAVVAGNLKAEILGQGKARAYSQGEKLTMLVPVGSGGGTGSLFGWTPWSAMVRYIKGKDFLIGKAYPAVAAQ